MLEAFNGEASVLRVRAAEFRTISERSQLDLWQGWLRQTEWRLAGEAREDDRCLHYRRLTNPIEPNLRATKRPAGIEYCLCNPRDGVTMYPATRIRPGSHESRPLLRHESGRRTRLPAPLANTASRAAAVPCCQQARARRRKPTHPFDEERNNHPSTLCYG